ncbi:hypothetical protein RCO48_23425 [Peribacillus frigoritolerans]|nr:hypothetical protein [Peribacillus frigoritolerans]
MNCLQGMNEENIQGGKRRIKQQCQTFKREKRYLKKRRLCIGLHNKGSGKPAGQQRYQSS